MDIYILYKVVRCLIKAITATANIHASIRDKVHKCRSYKHIKLNLHRKLEVICYYFTLVLKHKSYRGIHFKYLYKF